MALGSALGGVGGAIGNIAILAGAAGRSGDREAREALRLWQELQDPNFDWREITPAQLQVVAEIDPQFYEAVVPDEVKTAAFGAGRGDQLESLAYLGDVRREGLPLVDRLEAQDATDAIATESGRARDAVTRALAERGRLSGGQEIEARILAGQGDRDLLAKMGSNLARDRVDRRYGAALDAGALGGQVRGADELSERFNADQINRFNAYVADRLTEAQRFGAEERSRAEAYNTENRQRVADTNQLLGQRSRETNLDRHNQLAGALSDFQLARTAGASNQWNELARRRDARQAARAGAIRGIGQGGGQGLGGLFSL